MIKNKPLATIFILLMFYVIFIALFTNRRSICSSAPIEKLINLNDFNNNQYFTYRNNMKEDFIIIPLSVDYLPNDVVVKLLDNLYKNALYKNMKIQPQNEIELLHIKDKIKNGEKVRLKREPLLAIKVTQDKHLIDGIITGELKKITPEKTIIYPYRSHFTEKGELIGDKQNGYKINLDSLLVYDSAIQMTVDVSVYRKLYKSLLGIVDKVEYFLLTNNTEILSETNQDITDFSLLKLWDDDKKN
jgi:hypothetical protein